MLRVSHGDQEEWMRVQNVSGGVFVYHTLDSRLLHMPDGMPIGCLAPIGDRCNLIDTYDSYRQKHIIIW